MSNDLNDYQITRNLVIFFIVIAAITAILAGLGMYIQESDFRANLEEETGIVFVSSDISSSYLDHKGNFIDKKELEAIDDNGKKVSKEDSTLGKDVQLKSASEEDALNLKVNSVYHLEPKDFDKDLKSKLDKGEIFSFPFNYYSDFKLEDGIILKGEKDYFALIGRKTMCNWIGEHSDELPEEVEEFEDNDLDFEMM